MANINKEVARRHMDLLGRDLTQTIWQTWPDKATKKGNASTSTDRQGLVAAMEAGRYAGFALAKFPEKTLNGHAERSVKFIRQKAGFLTSW